MVAWNYCNECLIGNMPEWKAFRAVNRALLALEAEPAATPKPQPRLAIRVRPRLNGEFPSYMSLADKALTDAGKPIPTTGVVEYIAARRPLSGTPDTARTVIQSSLSKDKRFRSVPWEGRRAWWFVDRPVPKLVPKNETAEG